MNVGLNENSGSAAGTGFNSRAMFSNPRKSETKHYEWPESSDFMDISTFIERKKDMPQASLKSDLKVTKKHQSHRHRRESLVKPVSK